MTRFRLTSAVALLGSTALLATSAWAQTAAPQPGVPGAAAGAAGSATGTAGSSGGAAATQAATVADCDRLITVIEQRRPANAGVTVEQVRTFRTANNAQACRDALVRIDPTLVQAQGATGQGGAGGAQITVQQPAPAIRVEQASPDVTVQQAQPQVTVRQAQPEILVRQPAPTVTVDIPQPEIIVRMPQPEVSVAQAQPQVDVRQAQPNVQVVQPAQPQVQVTPSQPTVNVQQAAGAQAAVTMQAPEGQPNVRFERAEPRVTVNQAQGQPNVRIERAEGQPAQGAAQGDAARVATAPATQPTTTQPTPTTATTAQPAATGTVAAGAGSARAFSVNQLEDMNVYNARGNELGDVEDVLIGPNNQNFLVVAYGGFLGLGERRVVLPLDRFQVQNDRLIIQGLTEDQLRALPAFTRGAQGYRAAENDFRTELTPFRP